MEMPVALEVEVASERRVANYVVPRWLPRRPRQRPSYQSGTLTETGNPELELELEIERELEPVLLLQSGPRPAPLTWLLSNCEPGHTFADDTLAEL